MNHVLTCKLVEGFNWPGLGFLFDWAYTDLQNSMHKIQNQDYFHVGGYFKGQVLPLSK